MKIAKKRFGQHFMTDPHKADSLVNALDIHAGETVLEIGPGTGILTERILNKGAELIAVELDRDLIEGLSERFAPGGHFRLIESDIIKVNLSELSSAPIKIIGNLPYNISGAIFEWLIAYYSQVDLAIITVQREVANRVKAQINSRDYGSLSVLVQAYFDIKKLFDIAPGSFTPKPKVVSSALSLRPRKKVSNDINFKEFMEFVRGCFAQKRKKLVNSLLSRDTEDESRERRREQIENSLARLGKKTDIRAEQLTLDDFAALYEMLRH